MFRKNTRRQQPAVIGAASVLPEKQHNRLIACWVGTCYQEFFSRIDEETFAALYSDAYSRPNVLVGF